MEKNGTALSGKTLRKASMIAALLLTAVSLSACIVPVDRDYSGGGHRRHHWNNDNNWNGGAGWQGNGGGWQGNGGGWNRHH